MRGDIVFRIYGLHAGRDKDTYFGAFRTRHDALAHVETLQVKEMHGRNWAARYHDRGFVIREAAVLTDFEIPTLPKPRDRYCVRFQPESNRSGQWASTRVEVLRRGSLPDALEQICHYTRNHGMYQTFEPFRQGNRDFALISRDYTRTAVLDLTSSKIIAEEAETEPPGGGFCPVGFYVPDWWDVHDDSIIPGSEHWSADQEWPMGKGGFVWGCIWGDDRSWKVQYLDLSRIEQGIVQREPRFGYVELAVHPYQNPCLNLQAPALPSKPPPFIDVSIHDGKIAVQFSVEMRFDLATGKCSDWERMNDGFD